MHSASASFPRMSGDRSLTAICKRLRTSADRTRQASEDDGVIEMIVPSDFVLDESASELEKDERNEGMATLPRCVSA